MEVGEYRHYNWGMVSPHDLSFEEGGLEAEVQRFGQELWRDMQHKGPGIFDAQYWQGRLIDWAIQDESFKTDLFRFVDVLPTLRSADQVKTHVREYLLKPERKLPAAISGALKVATGGVGSSLAASRIRANVEGLARRFIAGQDVEEASRVLTALRRQRLGFTVDVLGEACLSEAEADRYLGVYRTLISQLSQVSAAWGPDAVLDSNDVGEIPRGNLSVKVSALYSQADVVDVEGAVLAINARLVPLCIEAKAHGVSVNLDMEDWSRHEITYAAFERLALHDELRSWPHLGVVLQAYLVSAQDDFERLLTIAKRRATPFNVRLVKGAYWDHEVLHAAQRGWTCPVWQDKAATDASYERLSGLLLDAVDELWPAFASHNLRSLSVAICAAEQRGIPKSAFELQVLYGMAEAERLVLAERGHRVRVYAPVGELLPGMAYLVRRLLENTSNQSFVRLYSHDRKRPEDLLAAPQAHMPEPAQQVAPKENAMMSFVNCPWTDFTDGQRRSEFEKSIAAIAQSFPRPVPVVVGKEQRWSAEPSKRGCPSESNTVVSLVSMASSQDADDAIALATKAFGDWNKTPVQQRGALLERLGDSLQTDRDELAALISWEVGKPWREADAEVAEAIDFCRYYAQQAQIELGARVQAALPGEVNRLSFEGRGVAAVISPWNFPLAILCGMATAALVAGNTVIMKPAEQASAIAHALLERMRAAGIPDDVIQMLPGLGEEVGAQLVRDPRVAIIAFTGSKAVGLSIVQDAGITKPSQPQIKRVIAEMGGKNAIVIDEDADLDQAVGACVESAFGYAGQKCSAASRLIAVDGVYDEFKTRLIAAVASLEVGPAHQPGFKVGPVIDAEAQARLLNTLASLGQGTEVLFQSRVPAGGTYVPCAVVEVADANHPCMQQELFGPIVMLYRAPDFDHALQAAMATEYALTGSVFSRTPSHLAQAERDFRVGNLYLNRGCTGALVHRQPFGGFKMSGKGIKAGGPGYLLEFADGRCVTENTERRGFAPDSSAR